MKIVSLRDVHRDRVRCSDQPLYRGMIFLWEAYIGLRPSRKRGPHGQGCPGSHNMQKRGTQKFIEEDAPRRERKPAITITPCMREDTPDINVQLFSLTLHAFFPYTRNNTSGCGKFRLFPTPFHLVNHLFN